MPIHNTVYVISEGYGGCGDCKPRVGLEFRCTGKIFAFFSNSLDITPDVLFCGFLGMPQNVRHCTFATLRHRDSQILPICLSSISAFQHFTDNQFADKTFRWQCCSMIAADHMIYTKAVTEKVQQFGIHELSHLLFKLHYFRPVHTVSETSRQRKVR